MMDIPLPGRRNPANTGYPRSFNNDLDTGRSLQIVVDQYTGNFYADTDRFNPYQDVVSVLGHAFVEVLPGLLKKFF
jgi:hypothetical protein